MFGRKRKEGGDESKYEEETSLREVDSPSEDALLIKVNETLKGELDRDSSVITLEKQGYFGVINLGEQDRIFDIDITLEHAEDIEGLDNDLHISELDPQERWERSYTITEADSSELPFTFKEEINTMSDSEDSSTVLVYGHDSQVSITLTLNFSRSLEVVKIEKSLPSGLEDARVTDYSFGETRISDDKLIWELSDVDTDSEITCRIQGIMKVEDIDKRPTGTAFIQYSGQGQDATKIVVVSADGYVRCRTYVDSDEEETEPDKWSNHFIFKNPSEFPIELHSVKIYDDDNVYLDLTFEEGEVIIPSGDTWESDLWETENEDIPMFKKEIRYTVKPEIQSIVSGELNVRETELVVAYGKGSKTYSETTFPSYRVSPVDILTTVTNAGSVAFTQLKIEDELPEYFALEDPESSIVINVGGKKLTKSKYEISIEPETEDLDIKRKLIVNINQQVEPDQEVELAYTASLIKPPADITFETNPIAYAILAEPAPELDIPIEDQIGTVEIKHIRRKITWSKEIIPASNAGRYDIILFLKNRSNLAIQNLHISDLVPTGFSIVAKPDDFETNIVKEDDTGTVIAWEIETLDPEDEIEIIYTVEGEGEYRSRDLMLSI